MVLKISLDEINKSLKFSAFIAFGVLFVISLVQIILTNTLFWQIVGVISGLIFVFLLTMVLIKALRPLVRAWRVRRNRRKKLKKKSFFEAAADMFRVNCYFKIMAIIWFLIILVGLEMTIRYFGLIDNLEKHQVLTNFGFMIITVSTALFILNFSKIFSRKRRISKKK